MIRFLQAFATIVLLFQGAVFANSDDDFEFYLEELVRHELPAHAPMQDLIVHYLVAATFDTTNAKVFQNRVVQIEEAFRSHPDKADRFDTLDRLFQRAFKEKIAAGERQRWIYTGIGAVAGAVIGIPVGRMISSSTNVLWIAIPAGALAGAGAGYLLGGLLTMPQFEYVDGSLNFNHSATADFISETYEELNNSH